MITIEQYYKDISNIEWVRYIFYILIIIFSMVTLYKLVPNQDTDGFDIDDSTTHADQDKRYLYTISDGKVTKYKRKNGKKSLEKNVSFSNMIGIKCIDGNLIILNSKDNKTMVVVMNPKTLNVNDHFVIPDLHTNIHWFDVYNGNIWLFGGGILYCFNKDWQVIGFWKFPKYLKHTTFGYWNKELFYTGTDRVLYVMELEDDEIKARVIETIPVPDIPICFMNIERPSGRQDDVEEMEYDIDDSEY